MKQLNLSERYCDYCECDDCKNGWPNYMQVTHAATAEGKMICDVCYFYEVCVNAVGNPCDDKACEHRPTIVGEWSK